MLFQKEIALELLEMLLMLKDEDQKLLEINLMLKEMQRLRLEITLIQKDIIQPQMKITLTVKGIILLQVGIMELIVKDIKQRRKVVIRIVKVSIQLHLKKVHTQKDIELELLERVLMLKGVEIQVYLIILLVRLFL